jgi:hypothetical protein
MGLLRRRDEDLELSTQSSTVGNTKIYDAMTSTHVFCLDIILHCKSSAYQELQSFFPTKSTPQEGALQERDKQILLKALTFAEDHFAFFFLHL